MKLPGARIVASQVALGAAIAVCAALLYRLAVATPQPMQAAGLARAARQLKSDAVEASLLARAIAAGDLPAHFARKHHEQLALDLHDLATQLDQPAPRGHEKAAERLREATGRLGGMLAEVPRHMADADAMARIARAEEAVAREADQARAP